MYCVKCKAQIADDSLYCNYCGKKQQTAPKKRKTRSVGNGSGTVYKRGKTWTAQYRSYTDEAGNWLPKMINRTKGGFPTASAAREYLPVLKAEPVAKERIRYKTLKQIYDEFIATRKGKTSKSTIMCYNAAINYFSKLHNKTLAAITLDDLQSCVDNCVKGIQTRRNMRTVIGLVYKYAIPRKQTTDAINYAGYLDVGENDAGSKCGFTAAQLDVIRKGAEAQPPIGIADQIYANCYMGYRITELTGLIVADYDAANNAFRGGGVKTEAGKNRVVTISPKIAHIISRYTKDKPAEAAVFTCPGTGGKWPVKRFRKEFYATLNKLGIENPKDDRGRYILTPHAMRHTFATLVKRVDAPDKDKLELIGHTDVEMLHHYQDVNINDLKNITDKI